MMVIQTLVFGRYFLKNNKVSLLLQGKQRTVFVASVKFLSFKQKLNFLENFIHYHDCDIFSSVKYFSDEINRDTIDKYDFFGII